MQEYIPPPNGFRTFLIVWITQSISVFGSALTFFALNIWLLTTLYPLPEQKPQLAWAISALGLCFAIPVVFGAPIAGAWADRHDRKTTMMAMDFFSGLLSTFLMILIINQLLTLPILLAITVLFAFSGAFHNAAFDASYSMIVPREQLPRANGMMQTIFALSGVLSPAVAAGIISLPALARQGVLPALISQPLLSLKDGAALNMGIDAVTFFVASATLVFLNIPSPKREDLIQTKSGGPDTSIWADIKQGALYIWHRRPMLWLLGTFTVANFVGGATGIFTTLILKFNLAADWSARGFTLETALALMNSVAAIGGVAGGVLISSWGGLKKRRVYGVVISLILSGFAQIAFGFSGWLYLSAAMLFIVDGMIPIMNSHSQAIWQSITPNELQGRVFSVRRLIAQFTWPLSTIMAGWLGGSFDPGIIVIVLGAIMVLFCIAQLFNPYLLRVEDKEYLETLAARAAAGS